MADMANKAIRDNSEKSEMGSDPTSAMFIPIMEDSLTLCLLRGSDPISWCNTGQL